jgi:hypothetical protein
MTANKEVSNRDNFKKTCISVNRKTIIAVFPLFNSYTDAMSLSNTSTKEH